MIRFLMDEDVTPTLREVAFERGYEAHSVQYLKSDGRDDHIHLRRMLEQDMTLVTGNWKDFRPMLEREEVHPGAISLPDVPRAEQRRLFALALDRIESSADPLDMVNTVVLVTDSGQVAVYEIPPSQA